jgi:hypothetical protein
MHRKVSALVPLVVIGAVPLAACGSSDKHPSSSQPSASSAPASNPTVSLKGVADSQTVGPAFTAKAAVRGFVLDPEAVGMAPTTGRGHLHFSLDNGKFDRAKYSGPNGKLAEQLGTDGKYSPAVAPQISYHDIPAGKHTLSVRLANNDHSDEGAQAKVTFTVADSQTKAGPDGERVRITSIKKTAGGFTAMVALKRVALDAKAVGKKPQAGHGHLHFQLDGGKFDHPMYSGANGALAVKLGTDGKYSPAVAPMITYDHLPKGAHTLKVFVANNDHSENGAVTTRTIQVS